MNVSVEHLGPCKKLLRVELEPAAVAGEYATVTKDFMKHAALPGFRAGKAPRDLILKSFGTRIDEEVKRKLLNDSYRKALEDNKFRPVTQPDLEDNEFSREAGLKYTATIEILPDFTLPEYKGLPAKRENRVVTDEDLERALNLLREQRATFIDVARPVQAGDYVVVNYAGTVDGKPITDLAPTARGLTEQQNFWLHVESKHFVPGFTDQLVGAIAGDKRTVNVTFPVDFAMPELVGKAAVYEVEVVQVKEKQLSELNEEFAKLFGAPDLAALRAGVRADLERDLKLRIQRSVRDQLVATLLAKVDFDLPDALVEQETRSVVYDIVRTNQERGVPKEAIDEKKDEIYSVASNSAREKVKAMLILNQIAEAEKIQASREEMTQRILALAAQHQIKPEKLLKQLQEQNGLGQIAEQIVTGKVLDFIAFHGQIEDVAPAPAPVPPAA